MGRIKRLEIDFEFADTFFDGAFAVWGNASLFKNGFHRFLRNAFREILQQLDVIIINFVDQFILKNILQICW